jgi:hypothetical protein
MLCGPYHSSTPWQILRQFHSRRRLVFYNPRRAVRNGKRKLCLLPERTQPASLLTASSGEPTYPAEYPPSTAKFLQAQVRKRHCPDRAEDSEQSQLCLLEDGWRPSVGTQRRQTPDIGDQARKADASGPSLSPYNDELSCGADSPTRSELRRPAPLRYRNAPKLTAPTTC